MMASKRLRIGGRVAGVLLAIRFVMALSSPQGAAAGTLELQSLIAAGALAKNRELRAAESRLAAAGFRITQARGLPDPMVSICYQNEGLTNYTTAIRRMPRG